MPAVESPGEGVDGSAEGVLMRTVTRIEVTDGPDKLVWLPLRQEPVPMGMHDELATLVA